MSIVDLRDGLVKLDLGGIFKVALSARVLPQPIMTRELAAIVLSDHMRPAATHARRWSAERQVFWGSRRERIPAFSPLCRQPALEGVALPFGIREVLALSLCQVDSTVVEQHSALTDREYATPGTSRGLFDIFRYRYLLSLLLKKGIATRYHGSVLGWVWSYVRPAAQFLMYYFVIGVILGANRGIEYFPVYLFSGIVAVNLFSEALRNANSAIVDNKALVKKIYLPRELFPLAATGVALVHFLPQAAILLAVCLFLGWTVTWIQVGMFLLGALIIVGFALGLGLFFGAINVAYRDATNIVDLILMFATWVSPVLYTWQMVQEKAPNWFFELYMTNPVTIGVEFFHEAFWYPIAGDPPRPDMLGLNTLLSILIVIATLLLGQLVFRKLEGTFAQNL